MPDFTTHESAASFNEQATPAPEKQTVSLALDADVVAWFQQQAARSGIDWQKDMNGVLRFYMDSTEAQLSEPEFEPATLMAEDMGSDRAAAEQAIMDRHQREYENVQNGSGLSEEFPSDLEARHKREWEEFEQRYPAPIQADAHKPADSKPTREGPDFIPF